MTTRLQPRSFLISGALLLAAASLASAAIAPVNLARSSGGARLTLLAPAGNPGGNSDDGVRAAQALLSEADPIGCALGAGTTTVLLSLPRAETLHQFDFLNLTATGRVTVAVSAVALPAESPRWRPATAAGRTFGARDEVVTCDLGQVEARYLKITFETQAPGRIDTFGLFGATTGENAAARPRLVAYGSVGRPGGGAHATQVLRVSSGSEPLESIVDGSLGSSHAFAAGDRRPTTVIDLGYSRTLGGVNIACRTGESGRLDVYTFSRRGDADAFAPGAGRQPAASVRVEGRSGLSRVTVPLRAENVRYLAVVFVPGADVVEGKDFKNTNSARNASRGGNGGSSDDRSSGTGNRSGSGQQGRSGNGADGRNGSTGSSGQYGNSPDGQSTSNQSGDGSAGRSGTGAGGSSGNQAGGGSGGQYGSGAGGDQSYAGGSGGNSSANGGSGYSGGGASGTGGGLSSGGAGGGGFSSGGGNNGGGGFSSGGAGGAGGGGFSGGGGSGIGGAGGGGGGFSLAEVAAFGPGGGGAGGGFGGFGAGGAGGFGGGDGGDIAFNGSLPGGGSNGNAFNFSNPGGGSSGGGSPLNLVPILPPPVGSDLITP